MNKIFTVGHSNGPAEELLALLSLAGIDCVVDVRSVPASAYTPQFNKESLKRVLFNNGIFYLHFGEEFGARRDDAIVDGQVNFEKAVTTPAFLRGVERIKKGLEQGYNIALMCSEADPLACHRFSMIARYFYDNDYEVWHILHTKEIKSHEALEREMIEGMLRKRGNKLPEVDAMFGTYTTEEQRRDAYRLKNAAIGYRTGEEYTNEV